MGGEPINCCLQHVCDEVKGWVGVFDASGKTEDRESADPLARGCLLPHDAFGDPRHYQYLKDGFKERKEPGCYSPTTGYWVWEEDYSWHFGKPQRVKEQKLGVDMMEKQQECLDNATQTAANVAQYRQLSSLCTLENVCPKERWNRDVRPFAVPCEPLEACLGDNKCAPGYAGKKCNKCASTHYRKDGFCLTCPKNQGLLLAMISLAALGVGAIFYVIKRLKINVGVISIGIDYFQVLGLFNNPLIPWPKEMTEIYNYLSSFSFSPDLAAPECIGSGMSSHEKWFMTEFIPLFIVFAVTVWCLLNITFLLPMKKANHHRKALMGQATQAFNMKSEVTKTIGVAFSTFLSVFYLMYVTLVKKAMDIFNCSPADPPDDPSNPTLFMDMQPDQVCFQPGNWDTGLHVKLIPYAIAAVACYGLAFPTFVFFKFQKNRKIIFEDQLLAAQDRGEKPISNPNCAFRKRYSSLYKNFKPKKWYWILCILARKLAICFIALMFRATPVFQLAIACSVVFAAFVGQLVNRPYMGMVERADVVMRASERDFNKGNKLLRKMSAFGESEDVEKAKKRLEMEQQAQIVTANALRESAKYFVNYNYVESFFMICSIFVCLSGIMFASGYFNMDYLRHQKAALAYLDIFVVVFSIAFFFYVIGMEITAVKRFRTAKNRSKWKSFKKKAAFHQNIMKIDNSNATAQEKQSASKIEAAFKGRQARKALHERIAREGTEEQRRNLEQIERKRRERQKKNGKKKNGKKKKKSSKTRGAE